MSTPRYSLVLKNNFNKLKILEHVESTPLLNNRMLASKLGCSIKLAHSLLTRLVGKGCLHVKKVHSRRWDYFLTPQGIAEKARLTYEFLDFSMHFYQEARKKSSQLCRKFAEAGTRKVALLGTGELAEIVFLGIKEWNLVLTDVFDDEGETFLNLPIKKFCEINRSEAEVFIVCTCDPKEPMNEEFMPLELPEVTPVYNIFGEILS